MFIFERNIIYIDHVGNYQDALCLTDDRCSKCYTKAFCNSAILIKNKILSQPKYRRPTDKRITNFNGIAIVQVIFISFYTTNICLQDSIAI